jgi:hypothetical protein
VIAASDWSSAIRTRISYPAPSDDDAASFTAKLDAYDGLTADAVASRESKNACIYMSQQPDIIVLINGLMSKGYQMKGP